MTRLTSIAMILYGLICLDWLSHNTVASISKLPMPNERARLSYVQSEWYTCFHGTVTIGFFPLVLLSLSYSNWKFAVRIRNISVAPFMALYVIVCQYFWGYHNGDLSVITNKKKGMLAINFLWFFEGKSVLGCFWVSIYLIWSQFLLKILKAYWCLC